MLTGFKTIILNALIAGSVPITEALLSANWVELVGPTAAMVIVAALNLGARMLTKTAIMQSE